MQALAAIDHREEPEDGGLSSGLAVDELPQLVSSAEALRIDRIARTAARSSCRYSGSTSSITPLRVLSMTSIHLRSTEAWDSIAGASGWSTNRATSGCPGVRPLAAIAIVAAES
jgi:hypothetical protein